MDTPLWYKISQHQFSYSEFLDRYDDNLFADKDAISIFILASLNKHDPYIDGRHILNKFLTNSEMTDRGLNYFYIYWLFKGNFGKESILQGNTLAGTFEKININLPGDFSDDYLNDCMTIILRSFFTVGMLTVSTSKYDQSDKALRYALKYLSRLYKGRFNFTNQTVDKLYRLSQIHGHMIEIREFLQGKQYPKILKPYRRDRIFVKRIIYSYWPAILQTLFREAPFDEWEIQELVTAHQKLYENGDVEFLFYYIQQFQQYFPENKLTYSLSQYLKPSSRNDRIRAKQYLKQLDPLQRNSVLPQFIPVSDYQVNIFLDNIEKDGFINAIAPYIQKNRNIFQKQITDAGMTLNNDVAFSTQNSIFLYPWRELVFHTDNKNMYVFLRSELAQLMNNKQNPYTREVLPDRLFDSIYSNHISKSLEEIWSQILRRSIDMQSI